MRHYSCSEFVLCAQTPRAPPLPVAAMLSPILWQLNTPNRFDMYSAGVMLLQARRPSVHFALLQNEAAQLVLLVPCQSVNLPDAHVNLARLFAGQALVCPTQPAACLLIAYDVRACPCRSSRACRACVKQGSCGKGRCAFVCTDGSQAAHGLLR